MAKALPLGGGPIMRANLTWASEVCGNGKTCPRVSSVTPWGTRIVVGKKVTDPELLAEVGSVADAEYAVEISGSLGWCRVCCSFPTTPE